MIKPMEIVFDDINHIIIDMSLVECYFVLFYVFVLINVPITDKPPGDFLIW